MKEWINERRKEEWNERMKELDEYFSEILLKTCMFTGLYYNFNADYYLLCK